jgi:hypothetical protein
MGDVESEEGPIQMKGGITDILRCSARLVAGVDGL